MRWWLSPYCPQGTAWQLARLGRSLRDRSAIITVLQDGDDGAPGKTSWWRQIKTTTRQASAPFMAVEPARRSNAAWLCEHTTAGLATARQRGRLLGVPQARREQHLGRSEVAPSEREAVIVT